MHAFTLGGSLGRGGVSCAGGRAMQMSPVAASQRELNLNGVSEMQDSCFPPSLSCWPQGGAVYTYIPEKKVLFTPRDL